MALTDEQKEKAISLKRQGMSNRGIAETLGLSKDAVNRFFKSSGKKSRECAKNSPARTRDCKSGASGAEKSAPKVRQKCATEEPPSDDDLEDPDRELMASMAYADARLIRKTAIDGLRRVKEDKDLSIKDRAWMESVYMKSLEKSTRMLGAWGGLDEIADRDNPALAQYAEAMSEMSKTDEPDDWETTI